MDNAFKFKHFISFSSEAIKKRKEAKENETQELIVETAVDYEDKCLKQLNTFKFADRKTNDVYNLENQSF